ncbi:MAG TPA: HNH endonuclease signature motif containing protein [Tepidisphaeraceae bacterium]|nr:HNH endonuclease signature motif containing protein [Tepidisphaeraceae bacterium]
MNKALERAVKERSGGFCEYCRLPVSQTELTFSIDHVIARQHGGATQYENLAFCCGFCNRHKGPNIAGIDPESRKMVSIFNPRLQAWEDHFKWRGAIAVGITPEGRATIAVLKINHRLQIIARRAVANEGRVLRDR